MPATEENCFKLVTEVTRPVVAEEEASFSGDRRVLFSQLKPHPEVDVIIEQHAPYAGTQQSGSMICLELDDEQEDEHLETLIESVAKDEAEMEEPNTLGRETPSIEEFEIHSRGRSSAWPTKLIRDFLKEDPGPIRADKYTGQQERCFTCLHPGTRWLYNRHTGKDLCEAGTLCKSHLCLREIKFEISGKKCLLCSAN